MKTKRAEWIIVHDGTKDMDAYMLECLRCGAKQRFVIPMSVDVWVAAAKAFMKIHGKCMEMGGNQEQNKELRYSRKRS